MSIKDIEARHAAALPGPYRWGGNTDQHDIALETRLPGEGLCEILGTRKRERTASDREIDDSVENLLDLYGPGDILREAADHADWDDEQWLRGQTDATIADEETGEYTPEFLAVLRRAMVRRWMLDAEGETRTDERLFLTRHDGRFALLDFAEDQAVHTVARNQGLPENTGRTHPKVYRADICDVRNPTGRFLASSWQDVADLLAEVERLTAENERLSNAVAELPDQTWCHSAEQTTRTHRASVWRSGGGQWIAEIGHAGGEFKVAAVTTSPTALGRSAVFRTHREALRHAEASVAHLNQRASSATAPFEEDFQ